MVLCAGASLMLSDGMIMMHAKQIVCSSAEVRKTLDEAVAKPPY